MFCWRGTKNCEGRNLQTHSDARELLRWGEVRWGSHSGKVGADPANSSEASDFYSSESSGFFSSEASGPEQQPAERWVASHRADRGEGGEQHGSLTGAGGGGFFGTLFSEHLLGHFFISPHQVVLLCDMNEEEEEKDEDDFEEVEFLWSFCDHWRLNFWSNRSCDNTLKIHTTSFQIKSEALSQCSYPWPNKYLSQLI